MFNGHQTNGTSSLYYSANHSSNADQPSRAALCNLVNTCYLNSVLYTLRYAPGFIRKIHHLVTDLQQVHAILHQNKHKSSSLGRNIPSLSGSSSRSNSSKDLLSLGNARNDIVKQDFLQIVEELHDLYLTMHKIEMRDLPEPYAPRAFKHAFVNKYKAFSGSQQQDAHEFLMCLLNSIGDTCQLMTKKLWVLRERDVHGCTRISEKINPKEGKSWSVSVKWRKRKNSAKDASGDVNEDSVSESSLDLGKLSLSCKLFKEDFEGVSVSRTRCLECEAVTEREEAFSDLCIPINADADDDLNVAPENLFKSACVTSEYLYGANKYYCEKCFRYNEARRDVCYQQLPRILIFQLKRFMSSVSGTEKINYYMPTPLSIACFCDDCCKQPDGEKLHKYSLFSVIMHKGATMAEGHYVSFVRDLTNYSDYLNCEKGCVLPTISTEKPPNNRIAGFFKTKSSSDSENSDGIISIKNSSSSTSNLCRSLQCCSIKSAKSAIESKKNWDMWLECNDEVIRSFTSVEFEQQLADHKKVTSTPYLLFYVRTPSV